MYATDVLITSLQLTASYKEHAQDDMLTNSTSMYIYKEENGGVFFSFIFLKKKTEM
jgi:hypothetical protein